MEGRQNGRAVIEDDLPVGIPHCLLHLGLVLLRLVPPPGRCVLLRYVGAAAGRGGTDIRLRMGILTSARHVVADEGALRHSLSVQRLLGEGGGHLPPHHPRQILRHGHLPQLLPVPHGEGNVRIRPLLLSGERLRLGLSPSGASASHGMPNSKSISTSVTAAQERMGHTSFSSVPSMGICPFMVCTGGGK